MEQQNKNEISIKELYNLTKIYAREVLRKWWIVALFILGMLAYFGYLFVSHIPSYKAELRYMVESASGESRLGGLLGNLGIGGSGPGYNSYKIMEISKSTRIIDEVIFQKTSSGDLLANQLIKVQGLADQWAKGNSEYQNFSFPHDSVAAYSDLEKIAYFSLYKNIVGDKGITPMIQSLYDGETGIFKFSATTRDQECTLLLVNGLYENTSDFFQNRVFEEQRNTRQILKTRLDSIQTVIDVKGRELARFSDNNRNLITRESEFRKNKLQLELQGLTTAYTELLKNYQLADYTLQSAKPFYLIIDQPFPPLRPSSASLIKNIILGIGIGGFLGVIFVALRRFLLESLK